jgi:AraC-like DNA-binding protein
VSLPSSGIHVFHSYHDESFVMKPTEHRYYELIWVEWGRGTVVWGQQKSAVKRGEWVVIAPGHTHSFFDDKDEPLSLLTLCVDIKLLKKDLLFAPLLSSFEKRFAGVKMLKLRDPFQSFQIEERYRKLLLIQTETHNRVDALLWCETGLLIDLLIRSEESVSTPIATDDLMNACLRHLNENFLESIRIPDLAHLAGLSYRRFTERFKKATGRTVHDALEEKRIAYATTRLVATRDIMHTALHSGFDDLSTFYRAFKRRQGLTPRKFLENQINKN